MTTTYEPPPVHIRRQNRKYSTKVRFNIRLEKATVDWMRGFAEAQDVSMTDVIVHALEDIQRRVGHRPVRTRQV